MRLLAELLTVEFESPRNALVFPTQLLAAPLPTADPHTAALCVRQCEELLEQRRSRDGIAGVVRNRCSEVSDRLGYSEPAAFTHAYTRWHGSPPSAHAP